MGGSRRLRPARLRTVRRTRRRRGRAWRRRRCRAIRGRGRRWRPMPVMCRRRRWRRRRGRLGVAERDCRDRGHCRDADCSGEEVPYSCLDLRGCRENCGGNRRGDDLRGAVDDLVHGWLLSCACYTNNNDQSHPILSRFVLFSGGKEAKFRRNSGFPFSHYFWREQKQPRNAPPKQKIQCQIVELSQASAVHDA